MTRIRTLAAAVALTLGTIAPFGIQSANAAAPVVLNSSSTPTTLTIEGDHLAPGAASVMLGSFGPLTIVSQTPSQLVVTLPTALTGFIEWLDMSPGTPLWRTATLHLSAMLSATVVFAITAGAGHSSYVDGSISGGSLVLTLVGFGLLTLGGWLGGAIVFTHGMRVLSLVDEPTARAVSPMPLPEKEEAERGG